jgi:transcriptional regulator with XRE-family HTH domain
MDQIGKRIRKYREEAGISQKKLGLVLGLSDKAISSYESGRTLPPIETLYRIAKQLKHPIHLFINEKSKEHSLEEKLFHVEEQMKSIITDLAELKKLFLKK